MQRSMRSVTFVTLTVLISVIVHVNATTAKTKSVDREREKERERENPIRKVTNMLKMMQKKVEEEGKKMEEMFDKYMCYCKTTGESLEKSIASAEERIPQLESAVKETSAEHQQLNEELKQHKKDRTEADEAMKSATALREKESEAASQDLANLQTSIKSMSQAIIAIDKGMGGFLQTRAAAVLRRLTLSMDMATFDRDLLSTFLSAKSSQEYEPQSGEILGILKQMRDQMQQDASKLVSEEENKKATFESLVQAKKKEIAAATKAIETKTGRVGELAVEIVTMKGDLEDTLEGYEEDKKFLGDIRKSCSTKKQEWELYQKTQAEELLALTETVKILNDDAAQELFKKTLAGSAASFMQMQSTSTRHRRSRGARALRHKRHIDPRLDLIEMALKGKKSALDQVIKRIDELAAVMQKEQQDDDNKKAFCQKELDKVEDEAKAEQRAIGDRETIIAQTEDSLQGVVGEISALMDSIKMLDMQVAEATITRKKEHAESVESLAANNAAKGLLEMAKQRLQKFYNPKLAKGGKGESLLEEDEDDDDDDDDGNSAFFMQVRAKARATSRSSLTMSAETENTSDDPAPPPKLDFKKKSSESGGVMGMIALLQQDLVAQIVQEETEEKQAQADYEKFIKDSSEKRALDSKAIADKEGAKAELESALQRDKGELKSERKDLMETEKELSGLHGECDWLLKNFDIRKEARQDELDAMQKAKAVLAGADFS